MKNVTNKKIAAVVGMALLGLVSTIQAAGTSSAQFLKMGAGARAAGMGDAFCSVSDDANATYWNPAGLAQVESSELSMMHNSNIEETSYQYLSGAMPLRNSTIGGFIQRLNVGTIDRYTANNVRDGSFDTGSMAVGASMGRRIRENTMMGFTLKFVQESIEAESDTTFAGDFGLLHKAETFNFGLAIQNIGPGLSMVSESSPLPMTVRAGASKMFAQKRLLAAVDMAKANDGDLSLNLGVEYKMSEVVILRGGYKAGNSLDVDGITNINGGLGLKLNRFNFDYSVSPFGDLGMAHRISLLVRFSDR